MNVEFNIKGLKCDNPNCNYVDMDIDASEYPKYLNTPCPKCGENLLTEDDLKAVEEIMFYTKLVHSLNIRKENDKKVKMNLDMDGSGKVKIKSIEEVKG